MMDDFDLSYTTADQTEWTIRPSNTGKVFLTISNDGELTLGPDVHPEEAAKGIAAAYSKQFHDLKATIAALQAVRAAADAMAAMLATVTHEWYVPPQALTDYRQATSRADAAAGEGA